jgi:hypothetical protein
MTLTYELQRNPGFVRFDVHGTAALEDIHQLIHDVADRTRTAGDKRVMVNLLAIAESLKFTDHYSVGEQVARELGHLDRLASVVPAERRTGASEKVANAQGMRLRVFTSVADAQEWLRED